MKEKVMKIVFFTAACVSILAVVLICVYLFAGGVPAFSKIGIKEFLFGRVWRPVNDTYGIMPMILGSIWVTLGATVIGVPIAILTSVFLAYYCPAKLYPIFRGAINLMAGIPSVVYGLFGLVVLVPFIKLVFRIPSGNTMLTASVLLAIMILPTVVGVAETAIKSVPSSYYEGALALGATHTWSVFFTVLPAAKSGILAGVVLGIGRAIGETMAVIMVAGNQARMPKGVFSGVRTLTSNIVLEMGYAADLHRESLIAVAVVLFIFILVINFTISILKRRDQHAR